MRLPPDELLRPAGDLDEETDLWLDPTRSSILCIFYFTFNGDRVGSVGGIY